MLMLLTASSHVNLRQSAKANQTKQNTNLVSLLVQGLSQLGGAELTIDNSIFISTLNSEVNSDLIGPSLNIRISDPSIGGEFRVAGPM